MKLSVLFITMFLYSGNLLAEISPQQIRKSLKSVVQILIEPIGGLGEGRGSGYAVAINDQNYIVTNNHVCEAKNPFNGKVVPAKYYASYRSDGVDVVTELTKLVDFKIIEDKHIDLCILQIKDKKQRDDIIPVEFASSPAQAGDSIFSISGPLGIFPILHEGRYGLYERLLYPEGDLKVPGVCSVLNISPGSSGAPVLNEQGELVGTVFSMMRKTSIGCYLPLRYIKEYIKLASEELK